MAFGVIHLPEAPLIRQRSMGSSVLLVAPLSNTHLTVPASVRTAQAGSALADDAACGEFVTLVRERIAQVAAASVRPNAGMTTGLSTAPRPDRLIHFTFWPLSSRAWL
jgi:hypothetical protein